MIRVLIAEDVHMVRGALSALLNLEPDIEVVAEVASGDDILPTTRTHRPDVAVIDIGLPDGDGVSLAGELTALPWRPRVVLTSTDPDAASPDAVRASGARAFIAKHDLPNAPLARLLSKD